ncbi:two-component system, sensor histidine kinase YesM [Trichococcus flocculiformis]|uniref:sensor histidine kinase n=1 Tax=Trichococcus TaxID=82802 RepID=UPI0007A7D7B6|nr:MULTISPECIES: sensor histidine kinase [Trichococcus]CZR01874.1 signal transduction histidine kinase internal region [Trichococcus sp. ES5]SHG00295.1 two-component system, sensor histidine kinase YesM [Trichococcus flocculiformis]
MEKIASIKDIFQQTNRLLFNITLIPLLVISIFYTRNILIYRSALANVEEANAVSTTVQENVLEELWDLVFGLIQVTDYESGNELEKVRLSIEEIQANTTTAKESATLDVALRTLDTLDNYISEMEKNISNGRPFDENEAIMVQVDAVTVLLYDILQDFVRVEIELAGKTSDDMLVSLYYLMLFELIIILTIIFSAKKNNRFLTQQIQEPLNDLIVLSEELSQGHLDYRAKEPEVAELRVVTESMNAMARNLHVLIEENAVKQFDLAQSELRVLQAQITPHFIYNTLDAILSLAEQGNSEQVKTMTYALSDFLRISLSKGQDWITIEKEIRHVEDYLTILQIRYGAMLTFAIDIPEEILQTEVLKMILQPLVENAVYHGTKHVRRAGKVTVAATVAEDTIRFLITDNGIGMEDERLLEIQARLAQATVDDSGEGGYGLYNVRKRLLLYYGNAASLQIDSTYRNGTTITVTVPKIT